MDILQDILNKQKSLQKIHGHDFNAMSIEEREQYTRDTILYLLEETHELLRETNFKTYKKKRKPIDIENIKEELIDIGCFHHNLCLAWGLDSSELYHEAYLKKNKKNILRTSDENY